MRVPEARGLQRQLLAAAIVLALVGGIAAFSRLSEHESGLVRTAGSAALEDPIAAAPTITVSSSTVPAQAATTTVPTSSSVPADAETASDTTETSTTIVSSAGQPDSTSTSSTSTVPPEPPSTTDPAPTPTMPGPGPHPNGLIVFVSQPDSQRPESRIAVMNGDGSGQRDVTHGHVDVDPVWSPDGRHIAFARYVDDGWMALFVMNGDGSDLHQVTFRHGQEEGASWSPDGTKLAFLADEVHVGVVDLTSGEEQIIAEFGAANLRKMAWSPDGAWIAWGGNQGISLVRPDGTDLHGLTVGEDDHPSWSPDATRLLVHRGNGVVIVTLDGTVSAPIADGERFFNLDWSPDGEYFLYDCNPDPTVGIGVCRRQIDGTGRVILHTGIATDADWQPLTDN